MTRARGHGSRSRRRATGAAGVLVVGVPLGAASIGLFFVPAAIALVLAAVWTAVGVDGAAEQERR